MVKARNTKFMKVSFKNRQELDDFCKKYSVKIERDTILLLRNRYLEPLYAFNSYDWFENQEYVFKYFKKISKLT